MLRFQRDPRKFTAAEVNRWNKLVDQFARGDLRQGLQEPARDPVQGPEIYQSIVWAKNNTGVDLDRYECAGLGNLQWQPPIGVASVDEPFVFDLEDPAFDRKLAILVDPIPDGLEGRVCVGGPCMAVIEHGFTTGWADNLVWADFNPDATGAQKYRLQGNQWGRAAIMVEPTNATNGVRILPVWVGHHLHAMYANDFIVIDSSNNNYFDSSAGYVRDASGLGGVISPRANTLQLLEQVATGGGAPANAISWEVKIAGRYRIHVRIRVDIGGSGSTRVYEGGVGGVDDYFVVAVNGCFFNGTLWPYEGGYSGDHELTGFVDVSVGDKITLRPFGTWRTQADFTSTPALGTQSDMIGSGAFYAELVQQQYTLPAW